MEKKVNIKIKNSVVIVGGGDSTDKIVEGFDLANATPVDCMHFLARLKEFICKKK